MSDTGDLMDFVVESMERVGAPYMFVGSFSVNHYAVARSTVDADIVVAFGVATLDEIRQALEPRLRMDPQVRFETVLTTTRYIFNDVETGFRVEFFELSDDDHDLERFQRRCRVPWGEGETWMPTAEDVVVMKLRWAGRSNRSKDREDVKQVIALQHDVLDWDYIYDWCDRHGTRALLDECKAAAGL